MMKRLFYITVLAGFSLGACHSVAQEENQTTQKLVTYSQLNATEFKDALALEKTPQLFDVRTPKEFQAGTITGAKNLNFLDGTFKNAMANLDKNAPVYVFCAAGGRSGKASAALRQEGFTTIIDLKGGYSKWPK
jgi:rhodanese-related sulfurtransferase